MQRLALHTDGLWRGQFEAMASPCELIVDGGDEQEVAGLLAVAASEALRIEHKFSRYRQDSELSRWHATPGLSVQLDEESAKLLDMASLCHRLSDGLFDVSSGVLREVWRFDGSDRLPPPERVASVLERVGWHKVGWQRPSLTLPAGMQLDLGGLGKEYAADRVLGLLRSSTSMPMLLNLGGDLVCSGPRAHGEPWFVGIERPLDGGDGPVPRAVGLVELRAGALATSGDSRRYLLKDGVRYSHILDPRTGWPVRDAPRSVTVAAPTCTEAGLLATLAMLHGPQADHFLREQGVPYWICDAA